MGDDCECVNLVPTDSFAIAHQAVSGHLPNCRLRPRYWNSTDIIEALLSRLTAAESERDFYRAACVKLNNEVEQILGKALGYPALYPEASGVDDGTVCVGDHVAGSLADEAAGRLRKLDELVRRHYGPFPFGTGKWTTRTPSGGDRVHTDDREAERAAWAAAFPGGTGVDV